MRLFKKILGRQFRVMMFEATTRCNHDCLHCYNIWKNFPDYPQGELSTAKTKELLDIIIQSTGLVRLIITGGEPTLRKDLEEIVEHATKQGAKVNLISNGSLLTKERVEALAAAGVETFQFPVLGGESSIHNELSAKDSFNNVLNAFSWAKKAGAKTVGVFVITRKNVHELEGAIKVCVALGLDGILINRIYPTGRGLENIEELKIGKEDIERALAVADEAVGLYGIIAFIGTIIHPCIIDLKKYKNLKFHTCPAGTTKGYYTVDPLGNLRVCNNSPEIVGNLFETPFWELHKSEKVKKFMEAHPEMCEPCKLKNICQGGCKACSWICSGDICTPEPFLRDNAQHVKCFK